MAKSPVKQTITRLDTSKVRRSTNRPTMRAKRNAKETVNEENVRDFVLDGLLTRSRKDFESQIISESDNALGVAQGDFKIEKPPYNLSALAALVDRSNILRQCIDAMVVNVESTGYHLEYIGPENAEESPAALAEKERIVSLMDDPNGDYSFTELRERAGRDRETIGARVFEMVRDNANWPMAFYHLPAHTMYLTKRDRSPTPVKRWLKRDGKYIAVTRNVYFRRFVQVIGTKKTFFKEFGDPRVISSVTGEEIAAGAKGRAAKDIATEVVYVPGYKSGYTYGVPRYMHQMLSIQGSRESEQANLSFFKNNAIPAMMVSVSGGYMTNETFADVKTFFEAQTGKEAQNRILVMEVMADPNAGASQGSALQPPKIEVKSLNNDRQNDALFIEYDRENMKKIRSAFRLPPLFVGMSEDVTYASAQASMELTEQQVFGPERAKVDEVINLKLLSDNEGKPPQYWWVRSNAPRISDPSQLMTALGQLNTAGAVTPNIAINLANDLFGLEIPPIVEPWGDIPFQATTSLMANGMVVGWEGVIEEYEEPPPPEPQVVGPDGQPVQPGATPPAEDTPADDAPPAARAEKKGSPVKSPKKRYRRRVRALPNGKDRNKPKPPPDPMETVDDEGTTEG